MRLNRIDTMRFGNGAPGDKDQSHRGCDASLLNEMNTLSLANADTPAKRIYFAVQQMYLTHELLKYHEVYTCLVLDFVWAAPSAALLLDALTQSVCKLDFSAALMMARALVDYETDLISEAAGMSKQHHTLVSQHEWGCVC
jgi:flagellar biosynthesis repressor protein FlbT